MYILETIGGLLFIAFALFFFGVCFWEIGVAIKDLWEGLHEK